MNTNNPTSERNHDIVGSVENEDFSRPHFIIADITTDDAWIAMPEHETQPLKDWR